MKFLLGLSFLVVVSSSTVFANSNTMFIAGREATDMYNSLESTWFNRSVTTLVVNSTRSGDQQATVFRSSSGLLQTICVKNTVVMPERKESTTCTIEQALDNKPLQPFPR